MDKLVFKNTLLLYFRTAVTMLIALYTSRVILQVLGVEDYGVYNVVGGVVAMFQTLSSTLAGATQRFITYALGTKDTMRLKQVFSVSARVHLWLAIIIVAVAEIAGVWFLNNHLNISDHRLWAANVVFQCSLASFAFDVISIPYLSAIVAYEKMKAYASIYIIQALMRLGNVFLLQYFTIDKLILYAFLELGVSFVVRLLFTIYCRRKCNNCTIIRVEDRSLYRQIISFCGWNFLGTSSAVIYLQGGNILLNMFFGVILNAAVGVTNQVQSAVNSFVNNFTIALNPQITKSYAAGDYDKVVKSIFVGSKISFYLLTLIVIPIIINTDYLLHLWLGNVPPYAVIFVQLSLTLAVVNTFFPTVHCALFATGNIKKYQILCLAFNLFNILLIYICFKVGISPIVIYVIPLVTSFFKLAVLTLELKNSFMFPIREFYTKVVFIGISIFITLLVIYNVINVASMTSNFLMFILVSLAVTFINVIIIYLVALNSDEKRNTVNVLKLKFHIR